MSSLRSFPAILITSIKSRLGGFGVPKARGGGSKGKGQSLLRLHEYQHRVIVELFRVSIAGFLGFSILLLGISLFSLADPYAPRWMSVIVALLSILLIFGVARTIKEFKAYRRNYVEITARLRAKLLQQSRGGAGKAAASETPIEHRLLSALKPKEYTGWDHKPCKNCQKGIELLARVCQHCGQEQETLLVN